MRVGSFGCAAPRRCSAQDETPPAPFTVNYLDQLTSVSLIIYDYDERGNLEQTTNGPQVMNYTWDATENLAMVDGSEHIPSGGKVSMVQVR